MANPKYKTSRSKRDADVLSEVNAATLVACSNKDCKELKLSHCVCPACGTIMEVITVLSCILQVKYFKKGEKLS
jgi:large subunit ribosomal protein L32